MSDLRASFGPWMVNMTPGEIGITDRHGNVIALVEEIGNAAIMASSKEMLDALIDVHEIVQEITDPDLLERIEDRLSLAFQKVYAESDIG